MEGDNNVENINICYEENKKREKEIKKTEKEQEAETTLI